MVQASQHLVPEADAQLTSPQSLAEAADQVHKLMSLNAPPSPCQYSQAISGWSGCLWQHA